MILWTWNLQGAKHETENKWQEDVTPLAASGDYVCLQESGNAPSSAQVWAPPFAVPAGVTFYRWGGTATRGGYYFAFYAWGQRVNNVIISKQAPGGAALVFPAAGPTHRAALGVLFPGVSVFCIHAISPGGADVPGLLAAAAAAAPAGVPWVVAGDFNREPPVAPYNCLPPNANTWPTNDPTKPPKRLDWCVTSVAMPNVVGQVNNNLFRSDHWSVQYQL